MGLGQHDQKSGCSMEHDQNLCVESWVPDIFNPLSVCVCVWWLPGCMFPINMPFKVKYIYMMCLCVYLYIIYIYMHIHIYIYVYRGGG